MKITKITPKPVKVPPTMFTITCSKDELQYICDAVDMSEDDWDMPDSVKPYTVFTTLEKALKSDET